MDHVIIRHAAGKEEQELAKRWARSTPDGDLLDLDVLRHKSTFMLSALRSGVPSRLAYLPVQQPLMLENLIFRPGLTDRERALAITRLTESVIGEAYRRDAGELYFLCRHPETCAFAERHKFERIDGAESRLQLKVYRLNLLESFGL